jgi:uncharacterized membrane protein
VTAAAVDSPAYDLVLVAHVLAAVVGGVALCVAAGSALALRGALARGGPLPGALARYYRPGVNWAGRTLFLVPVFGVALLAMSGGRWSFADTWVALGMSGWAVVAVVAEAVLWPEERRLQEVVAQVGTAPAGDGAGSDGDDAGPDRHGGRWWGGVAGRCVRAGVLGIGLATALVALGVLMVAKP